MIRTLERSPETLRAMRRAGWRIVPLASVINQDHVAYRYALIRPDGGIEGALSGESVQEMVMGGEFIAIDRTEQTRVRTEDLPIRNFDENGRVEAERPRPPLPATITRTSWAFAAA